MKTPSRLDPLAAFPDENTQPNDAALQTALGGAFGPIEEILAGVNALWPNASGEWKFSKQSGWYRVAVLKKRHLFYLVPQRGSFRLSVILGDRAIAAVQSGAHRKRVEQLLRTAKRYPEGTAFAFEPAGCDPGLVVALLAAKLAP